MGLRLYTLCLNCLFQSLLSGQIPWQQRPAPSQLWRAVQYIESAAPSECDGCDLGHLENLCIRLQSLCHLIRGNIMQVIIVCMETDGSFTQNVPGSWCL